jgi:hypothetical protein
LAVADVGGPSPQLSDAILTADPSGPAEARLTRGHDGTLSWAPLPSDAAALGTVLALAEGIPASVVTPDSPRPGQQGLGLRVSGRALLLLPGTFDDVQVEAMLDVSGFAGTVGLAHHVAGSAVVGLFTLSADDGSVQLVSLGDNQPRLLDSGTVEPPSGSLMLAVSAAGQHLKGFIGDRTVAHGHTAPADPGGAGLFLDGAGVVRIHSMRVVPLEDH